MKNIVLAVFSLLITLPLLSQNTFVNYYGQKSELFNLSAVHPLPNGNLRAIASGNYLSPDDRDIIFYTLDPTGTSVLDSNIISTATFDYVTESDILPDGGVVLHRRSYLNSQSRSENNFICRYSINGEQEWEYSLESNGFVRQVTVSSEEISYVFFQLLSGPLEIIALSPVGEFLWRQQIADERSFTETLPLTNGGLLTLVSTDRPTGRANLIMLSNTGDIAWSQEIPQDNAKGIGLLELEDGNFLTTYALDNFSFPAQLYFTFFSPNGAVVHEAQVEVSNNYTRQGMLALDTENFIITGGRNVMKIQRNGFDFETTEEFQNNSLFLFSRFTKPFVNGENYFYVYFSPRNIVRGNINTLEETLLPRFIPLDNSNREFLYQLRYYEQDNVYRMAAMDRLAGNQSFFQLNSFGEITDSVAPDVSPSGFEYLQSVFLANKAKLTAREFVNSSSIKNLNITTIAENGDSLLSRDYSFESVSPYNTPREIEDSGLIAMAFSIRENEQNVNKILTFDPQTLDIVNEFPLEDLESFFLDFQVFPNGNMLVVHNVLSTRFRDAYLLDTNANSIWQSNNIYDSLDIFQAIVVPPVNNSNPILIYGNDRSTPVRRHIFAYDTANGEQIDTWQFSYGDYVDVLPTCLMDNSKVALTFHHDTIGNRSVITYNRLLDGGFIETISEPFEFEFGTTFEFSIARPLPNNYLAIGGNVRYPGDEQAFLLVLDEQGLISNLTFSSPMEENITLWPNPANDHVNIAWEANYSGSLKLQVFNANGQILQQKELLKSTEHIQTTLDVSAFPLGYYFIVFNTPSGRIAKKFIKQ